MHFLLNIEKARIRLFAVQTEVARRSLAAVPAVHDNKQQFSIWTPVFVQLFSEFLQFIQFFNQLCLSSIFEVLYILIRDCEPFLKIVFQLNDVWLCKFNIAHQRHVFAGPFVFCVCDAQHTNVSRLEKVLTELV